MSAEITHKGRITDINPVYTTVEIISESACSACHAKGLCGVSEAVKKEIHVRTSGWDTYAPGDEVTVVLKASMGHKAVWVAYVFPLFVLLTVLLLLSTLGASELAAGLGGIAAVAVYYFCIWLMRNRLKNEYSFNIRK